jgi:hypothetical protein
MEAAQVRVARLVVIWIAIFLPLICGLRGERG